MEKICYNKNSSRDTKNVLEKIVYNLDIKYFELYSKLEIELYLDLNYDIVSFEKQIKHRIGEFYTKTKSLYELKLNKYKNKTGDGIIPSSVFYTKICRKRGEEPYILRNILVIYDNKKTT